MDAIFYHRYVLCPRNSLNARSGGQEREGCLIRVGDGVGCIHPWPELGDDPLEKELAALKEGAPLRLGERALHCAKLDGRARKKGVSLFDGLSIPDSHMTVVPGMKLDKVKTKSFSAIKLKGTRDLEETASEARRCMHSASEDCRLRIDFNESLDHALAMNLAQVLEGELCERIEFIEDPSPYDSENWSRLRSQTKLAMAVDRQWEKALQEGDGVDFLVIKPALVDPADVLAACKEGGGEQHWVVTSYMDHAIGQTFAAYEAAILKKQYPDQVSECGLLTHELYEQDDFFEMMVSQGPALSAPPGTGLGFDEQVESLSWERL